MSRVKGHNTQPERLVRSLIHKMGFRFRINRADLPGKPDIVLPRHKKIVFVHGCFWHGHKGCRRSARPSTNVEFWDRKLSGNIKRDQRLKRKLERDGWRVLIVWSCETRNTDRVKSKLTTFLRD